jgi:photosystem II stability/assembly factor-like uncharacterized protein
MISKSSLLVAFLCAAIPLVAQDQPPAGQVSAPGAPATLPAAPAPAPILTNDGKPIVVPFQCTAEDIQAAGFSCSEEAPCPVYLELSAAAANGNRYYVAGNIHSDAVTLYSVLLGSEDAGKTWQEIYQRVRGAGLDHLQFLDASTGWAGGQQLFPLPQEPFVLLTTDAGKSWRQQPVLGESAENHFGSVQEMYFSSKTNGSLVVDRSQGGDAGPFALYESPDGGESWNIKEQSHKPIHLKGAPAQDSEWRLRVDESTKAFHVEHSQGARWTSHAAFAVNLGSCKLAPQ